MSYLTVVSMTMCVQTYNEMESPLFLIDKTLSRTLKNYVCLVTQRHFKNK